MRQFAPSTIAAWVDHRLYLDPADSLLPRIAQLRTAPQTLPEPPKSLPELPASLVHCAPCENLKQSAQSAPCL